MATIWKLIAICVVSMFLSENLRAMEPLLQGTFSVQENRENIDWMNSSYAELHDEIKTLKIRLLQQDAPTLIQSERDSMLQKLQCLKQLKKLFAKVIKLEKKKQKKLHQLGEVEGKIEILKTEMRNAMKPYEADFQEAVRKMKESIIAILRQAAPSYEAIVPHEATRGIGQSFVEGMGEIGQSLVEGMGEMPNLGPVPNPDIRLFAQQLENIPLNNYHSE